MFVSVEALGTTKARLILSSGTKIVNLVEYNTSDMNMYEAMDCLLEDVDCQPYPKCRFIEPMCTLGLVENLELDLEYMVLEIEGACI